MSPEITKGQIFQKRRRIFHQISVNISKNMIEQNMIEHNRLLPSIDLERALSDLERALLDLKKALTGSEWGLSDPVRTLYISYLGLFDLLTAHPGCLWCWLMPI